MAAPNFKADLAFSESIDDSIVFDALRRAFGGAVESIRREKDLALQRRGVDYWVRFQCGTERGVDLKLCRYDDSRVGTKMKQPRTVPVELWSDVAKGKPGWSVDDKKQTDYILILYADSLRGMLFEYRTYRAACQLYAQAWGKMCFTHSSENRGWTSHVAYPTLQQFREALLSITHTVGGQGAEGLV